MLFRSMNKRIKKLATVSYDMAREKCEHAKHNITDTDVLFTGFAMNEMYYNTVKDCIQTLVDHGYDDAATCLTKELLNV